MRFLIRLNSLTLKDEKQKKSKEKIKKSTQKTKQPPPKKKFHFIY